MLRKHTRRHRHKPTPAIAPTRCTKCRSLAISVRCRRCTKCRSLAISVRCRRWACQSCTTAGRY